MAETKDTPETAGNDNQSPAATDGGTTTTDSTDPGFTGGKVSSHLLRLGSFMAMGSITMNVAQLAEAVYLGIVGTEALAAMGFALPVTIMMFAFAGGIGTGASSVIARAMGSGGRERAALLVTHAQLLALLVGITVAVLGAYFAVEIAHLIGARGLVAKMTVDYLVVYMIGVPFFMLTIIGSTLLRATGNAASPGIVMTAGSIMQIAFGPFLIFGWFGLPELGVAGAAWAYVLSRLLSVVFYAFLLVRIRMLRFTLVGVFASWAAIMKVGLLAIASGLVHPISMFVVTKLLSGHGHEVVAGYNVASRVETMAHMILWSASSSVEPFVGQNWGARQYERAKQALRMVNQFSLAWGVITFALMWLVGRQLVGIIDDDPIVGEVAAMFFWIIPLSIGFMGMMQVATASFNALGNPMPALVISIGRTFICYVPLCYLGDYYYGYVGIFIATAATNVLMGLAAWQWSKRFIAKAAAAG